MDVVEPAIIAHVVMLLPAPGGGPNVAIVGSPGRGHTFAGDTVLIGPVGTGHNEIDTASHGRAGALSAHRTHVVSVLLGWSSSGAPAV